MQAKKVGQWRVRQHAGGDPGEWSEGCWSSVMLARWAEQTSQEVTMSLDYQEGDGPTEKRMTESRCGQMASEVCSRINNWHKNNQAKERKRGNYLFGGKDIIKMLSLQYIAINNTDIIMQTLNIYAYWGKGITWESRLESRQEGPRAFTLNSGLLVSCSVLSDSLQPHGLHRARLPRPPPSFIVCSRPLSRWCHLTISASVFRPFSYAQSSPASDCFPISRLFQSGGQSTGVSASVLPVNIQSWFP